MVMIFLPLMPPTGSAKLASSNGCCICPGPKNPRSPPRAQLPQSCRILAYMDDICFVCDKDAPSSSHKCEFGQVRIVEQNSGRALDGLGRFREGMWTSDSAADRQGFKVLGTRSGTAHFRNRCCAEHIDEKAQLLNLLPKLPSLQTARLL